MADIFISYSSRDRERAQKLAEELRVLEYSVWLDVCDIDPATRWSTEIAEAINTCRILMLLLSKASLASENVLKELSLAAEKKKHILPVILEKAPLGPDFEYHLAGLQHTAIENLEAITRALEHFISTHKQSAPAAAAEPTVTPRDGQKRVVVLPFDDLSPDHDNEWFSDGLADELISNLSKLSGLFVIHRISARQYKDTRLTLQQIARELEVQYIITGSVRKSGDRIQIKVTLIDASTGRSLWEEKYPGTMDDIFAIQEQVSLKIADALKLILTNDEKVGVGKHRTKSAEAYEFGLRAASHVARNTKQDYLYAVSLYEHAIKLDPNFAWAHANLGQVYLSIYPTYDRDASWLEKAEPAIRRALELQPDDAACHSACGIYHARRGNAEEAIREGKKAIELSPGNPIAHFQLGFIYDALHQYRNAAEAYEQCIALMPNDLDMYNNLILDYDLLQDTEKRKEASEKALPQYERYLARNPDDQNKRQKYASLLYFTGRREECFRVIETLLKEPGIDPKTYYNCACRYAVDGQTPRAFELLMKALEGGYADYEMLMTDPDLTSLRSMEQWLWLMNQLQHQEQFKKFKTSATSG